MSRQWWQYKNWPDGTSGSNPNVTGQDPNAVELWPAGTLPNQCTMLRAAWLNQFLAWRNYISQTRKSSWPDWITAYHIDGQHYWNDGWLPFGAGCALQDPSFWNSFGTLDKNTTRILRLPFVGIEHEPEDGQEEGETEWVSDFVSGAEFDALPDGYSPGDAVDLDDIGLYQPASYLSNNPPTLVRHGSNLHNILPYIFLQIRSNFDKDGAVEMYYGPYNNDYGYAGLIAIGGQVGRHYERDGEHWSWGPTNYSRYPTGPFPRYELPGGHERATWDYPKYKKVNGVNYRIHFHNSSYVGARISGAIQGEQSGYSSLEYITAFDAWLATELNYRHAIASFGKPSDSPGGGYVHTDKGGFCHATFELPTYLNLDNPPSRIIAVGRLGNGDSSFIEQFGTDVNRRVEHFIYPYERIPDEFKGPDWPMVNVHDEDSGDDVQVPYLANDRHNRWLDEQSQQP